MTGQYNYIKNFSVIVLLFFAAEFTFSQSNSAIPPEIICGYKYFQKDLSRQLQTTSEPESAFPMQMAGFSLTSSQVELKLNGKRFDDKICNLSYLQLIPKTIEIYDSLKLRLTGYIFSFSMGRDLFVKSRNFDLITGFGLGFGRTNIRDVEVKYFKKKNALFSPVFSLSPGYRIGRLYLGLRGVYNFDISHYAWRQIKVIDKPLNLNKLNQSGASIFFTIGLDLN
ncbi:MAG: hypothetical protein A2W91_09840 [Bacteroidetes bacterium GWF2_38_335]|nr:MAG: hypothetical protein A2W91_09840 [Bacteroidetes bacterium GWF2_38_335]HBS88071.1 hypothetical protein [Bacteroidales bacterium]